ncbi:hypothetical protein [Paludisphaera borealis]|uniref:Glycosyltransferase RgtA/B/C/D-like domain-containing protein n=1 Tax=Paludisphaera borealis TaxID=1387353 RepID=A0A1U7CP79_9BACT|nr:hypothetical protein [Paludisphaera borealis]APW60718.1 hypothetical protein BSF38_02206 [Paludisphaera borealis]
MSPSQGRKPLGIPRLILLGAGAAVVLLGLYLADDLISYLPRQVRSHALESAFAAVLAGYVLSVFWAGRRGTEDRSTARLARGLDRLDALSTAALRSWLVYGLVGAAVVWLAIWIPHYLYWPWCRDVEAFAEFAHGWNDGELPYRDIRGYNFPGHIYLHWILGKLFGWGYARAFYGVDAAALLMLGGVVLAWSRRCFGGLLPGMAAYLMFLGFYLDQHFEVVAERDWHAALGATLGILVLQAWPGRRGRWLAAFLAAAAFTIRPHVVLFLPALADAAIRSEAGSDGDPGGQWSRRGVRRLLEWTGAFGLFVTVGFAPLIVAGVLGDLVRSLRVVAYGGPYSTFTPARAVTFLVEEIQQPTRAALLIALTYLSLRPPRGLVKANARTWLLAVVGALFYRPLHPMDHSYLRTPLALVGSTAWAIPIAWCARIATENSGRLRRPFPGLLLIVLLLFETLPRWFPYNCDVRATLDSIRAAATSRWPRLPPGAWIWFDQSKQPFYTWDGYIRLLRYVRETTGPTTIVANALNNPPFPCVNGPTGRRSPFHVETGVAWMWLVHHDLDEEFAHDLEQAGDDSIVVWSPTEIGRQPRIPLKRLTQVILDEYEPEARFGLIEVWRRKSNNPAELRLQSRGNEEVPNPLPSQVSPP